MAYDPIPMSLVVQAQAKLGLTNVALAHELGVSKRTVQRWLVAGAGPTPWHAALLARLLAPVDAELARELGERARANQVALGFPPEEAAASPVAASGPAARDVSPEQTERVIFAAASAADVTPRVARQALDAAVRRALALGLDAGDLAALLEGPPEEPR